MEDAVLATAVSSADDPGAATVPPSTDPVKGADGADKPATEGMSKPEKTRSAGKLHVKDPSVQKAGKLGSVRKSQPGAIQAKDASKQQSQANLPAKSQSAPAPIDKSAKAGLPAVPFVSSTKPNIGWVNSTSGSTSTSPARKTGVSPGKIPLPTHTLPPIDPHTAETGWQLYNHKIGPKPKPKVEVHPESEEDKSKRRKWEEERRLAEEKRCKAEEARRKEEQAKRHADEEAAREARRKAVMERIQRMEKERAEKAARQAAIDEDWKRLQAEREKRKPVYERLAEQWEVKERQEDEARRQQYREKAMAEGRTAHVLDIITGKVQLSHVPDGSELDLSASKGALGKSTDGPVAGSSMGRSNSKTLNKSVDKPMKVLAPVLGMGKVSPPRRAVTVHKSLAVPKKKAGESAAGPVVNRACSPIVFSADMPAGQPPSARSQGGAQKSKLAHGYDESEDGPAEDAGKQQTGKAGVSSKGPPGSGTIDDGQQAKEVEDDENEPQHMGAFQKGKPYNFNGKMIYAHCRTPVHTPSNWDPELGAKSAELPNASLQLEMVFGYAGHDTAQNLFYTADNHAVYYTAGVGVVYERKPAHRQHFFLGHTDDIKSMAVCNSAISHANKEYASGRVIATGQVSSHEEGPIICIWDSHPTAPAGSASSLSELARIQLGKDDRAVLALGFSPDGTKLAAVASDDAHSVYVYDWRSSKKLFWDPGYKGDPPQVYGLEWCPWVGPDGLSTQFVTFGKRHIKLWVQQQDGSYNPTQMSFGLLPMANITSAAWLRPSDNNQCQLVAGTSEGQLYVFQGTAGSRAIAAHKPGASIRGLRVCRNSSMLLSGGADGKILQWNVADGTLTEDRMAGETITVEAAASSEKAPTIRSLDYNSSSGGILVGDGNCDIWEVPEGGRPRLQISGHSTDIQGLAFHPKMPHVCATVCDGTQVFLWDLKQRELLSSTSVGFTARAVAFSRPLAGQRHHLAVGGAQGEIKVVDADDLQVVDEMKHSSQGISSLQYSPNGEWLAAATFDQSVEVYKCGRKQYSHVAKCTGHSATVKQVDWSTDSKVLQSVCAANELLYWDAQTGKQLSAKQRNTAFATWTCQLGFPVMGIWPLHVGADGTDINALDRSPDEQLLVTADDSGLVKLFNYPCVVEGAPSRVYKGHSSHVMCVRFNSDGQRVCSVGGKDRAMFVFKVAKA